MDTQKNPPNNLNDDAATGNLSQPTREKELETFGGSEAKFAALSVVVVAIRVQPT